MNALLPQPIEGEWAYVWINATNVKVQQDHRVRSVAVIIAVDLRDEAEEDVLA